MMQLPAMIVFFYIATQHNCQTYETIHASITQTQLLRNSSAQASPSMEGPVIMFNISCYVILYTLAKVRSLDQ